MRKIVVVLFLLVVVTLFATPYASAQSNAQPVRLNNPLLPPPGVEDLYVHITRVGFLDYRDPSGWDIHFDVIGGPARPYPHLYQKVIVIASKPDETTRRYDGDDCGRHSDRPRKCQGRCPARLNRVACDRENQGIPFGAYRRR